MRPASVGRVHVVVGELAAARTALEFAHAEGRLLGVGEPTELADGRVRVLAQLLNRPAARGLGRCRVWLPAVGVLGGVVAAGGLVWLLVLGVIALVALVSAAAGWIAGHLVWISLGLLAVLLLGARRSCAGLHCGGCRR